MSLFTREECGLVLTTTQLNEIISDEDGLTDPACMDRVLGYLEHLEAEAEEFMELLLRNIHDTTVWWEQPWYQKSNLLTRPPPEPASEEEEIYRTDAICKAEKDKIEKNWQKFRKKYGLPDKLICFARWKNKDKSRKPSTPVERIRKFVTAYLARGLQRNLYQVYKHIITWYGAPVKGLYSNVEKNFMEMCFNHAPQKAVLYISALLGREPRRLYKMLYEKYNGKRECKKLKWTLPLVTKYLNLLIKYSGSDLDSLKNKKIDKSIWLKLEEDMNQHFFNLRSFWYNSLHTQVFVKLDVKIKKLRRRIFKILRTYPYLVWTDIRWQEIVKHFPDGFTPAFLYRTMHLCVRQYPKYRVCPLEDVINFGLMKTKSDKRSKRLRTLAFNEQGDLDVVKHDKKF